MTQRCKHKQGEVEKHDKEWNLQNGNETCIFLDSIYENAKGKQVNL